MLKQRKVCLRDNWKTACYRMFLFQSLAFTSVVLWKILIVQSSKTEQALQFNGCVNEQMLRNTTAKEH